MMMHLKFPRAVGGGEPVLQDVLNVVDEIHSEIVGSSSNAVGLLVGASNPLDPPSPRKRRYREALPLLHAGLCALGNLSSEGEEPSKYLLDQGLMALACAVYRTLYYDYTVLERLGLSVATPPQQARDDDSSNQRAGGAWPSSSSPVAAGSVAAAGVVSSSDAATVFDRAAPLSFNKDDIEHHLRKELLWLCANILVTAQHIDVSGHTRALALRAGLAEMCWATIADPNNFALLARSEALCVISLLFPRGTAPRETLHRCSFVEAVISVWRSDSGEAAIDDDEARRHQRRMQRSNQQHLDPGRQIYLCGSSQMPRSVLHYPTLLTPATGAPRKPTAHEHRWTVGFVDGLVWQAEYLIFLIESELREARADGSDEDATAQRARSKSETVRRLWAQIDLSTIVEGIVLRYPDLFRVLGELAHHVGGGALAGGLRDSDDDDNDDGEWENAEEHEEDDELLDATFE